MYGTVTNADDSAHDRTGPERRPEGPEKRRALSSATVVRDVSSNPGSLPERCFGHFVCFSARMCVCVCVQCFGDAYTSSWLQLYI